MWIYIVKAYYIDLTFRNNNGPMLTASKIFVTIQFRLLLYKKINTEIFVIIHSKFLEVRFHSYKCQNIFLFIFILKTNFRLTFEQ